MARLTEGSLDTLQQCLHKASIASLYRGVQVPVAGRRPQAAKKKVDLCLANERQPAYCLALILRTWGLYVSGAKKYIRASSTPDH